MNVLPPMLSNPRSRLLHRRGSAPLGLSVESMHHVSSNSTQQDEKPRKQIKQMDEEVKIFDIYSWKEVLQEEGDGGKVVVCQPKDSYLDVPRKTYVMKMRSKKSLQDQSMEEQFRLSQVKLLNLPEHAGVLPLQEVLEDDKFYYIVMEKATGGSFFAGLLSEFQDGIMPAEEIKRLMHGVLEAIGHVHKQGMLHRDIKPDNLVMRFCDDCMSPTGKSRRAAIIDFDHADSEWRTAVGKQGFCGTARFSAPETFRGYFSQSSDLYSVGTILYLLMAGKLPYPDHLYLEEMEVLDQSPNAKGWTTKLYNRMRDCEVDWACDPWPQQPQSKAFCQWLIHFDPLQRPASADEAFTHKWFCP